MDTKLTLKLREDIIIRAKAFAKASGTSLSRLVEQYFEQLTSAQNIVSEPLSTMTGRLYGIASEVGLTEDPRSDYFEQMLDKHTPSDEN